MISTGWITLSVVASAVLLMTAALLAWMSDCKREAREARQEWEQERRDG